MKYTHLFLFLILLASASAAPEKLDDRWVYYGDSYERNDLVYFVEESNNLKKMLFYADDRPFIIDNGTCEGDSLQKEKYCITEMAWQKWNGTDYEYTSEKYIKYESGEQLFGFHLITYTLVPELEVTRTIKPADAELHEKSIITVTMTNEGEKDITGIKYTEDFPSSLDLTAIDGQVIDGDYIYEKSRLAPGATHVFQYAFKPQAYVSEIIEPEVTYTYENLKKEADVKKLTVTIDSPMNIVITKSATSLSVNDKATYNVEITNEADSKLDYDVRINLADGMDILERDELEFFAGRSLIYESTLAPNKKESFGFTYKTPFTGTYPFTLTVNGVVEGKKIMEHFKETITTKTQKLEPRLVFSTSDNKIKAGNTATLRVYMKNNEEDLSFVNIQADISGDILTENISSELVTAKEDQLVAEFTVTAPEVEQTTNKKFVLTGTYETRNGEVFDLDKTLTISVSPNEELFEITQKLNMTDAHPGDTIKVEVDVKNIAGRYVFANAYESFSSHVDLVSGNTNVEISLEEDEKRAVYIYEFEVPEDFTGDMLNITTSVSEEQLSLTQEETISIYLTPRPEETVEETDPETEPESERELEEKKPNFFVRAWRWIVDLFN